MALIMTLSRSSSGVPATPNPLLTIDNAEENRDCQIDRGHANGEIWERDWRGNLQKLHLLRCFSKRFVGLRFDPKWPS
jgi:hypothetical protein